jgi:hypothetical protein
MSRRLNGKSAELTPSNHRQFGLDQGGHFQIDILVFDKVVGATGSQTNGCFELPRLTGQQG